MKKILVAFDEPKLLKAITKKIHDLGAEELEFVIKQTKASVIDEISADGYEAVLLMENCGKDSWSVDEILQVKDSYNVNLIPIIPETYRGTNNMRAFSNYSITSAVFIKGNGTYRADEIVKMIYSPRSLKEARSYYGIETVSDYHDGDGNILDETVFQEARNMLLNEKDMDSLGKCFLESISDFTPGQAGDFIRRLDEEVVNELKKTTEFYDVLEILKKSKVIKKYRIPSEIRWRRRNPSINRGMTVPEGTEDIDFESRVVADIPAKEIDIQGENDGKNLYYIEEDRGDMQFPEGEEVDALTDGVDGTKESAVGDGEPEFSFSMDMQVEEAGNPAEKKMRKKEKREEQTAGKKTTPLAEKLDEPPKKENTLPRWMVAGTCIAGATTVLILLFIFVKITMERGQKPADPDTGSYDTLYNADDVARYEITENGSPVLYDEDGNVVFDASVPQEMPEGAAEEIDFAVAGSMDEDAGAFEDGADYKGLDLVNMLNGTQGADCTLNLKNGAVVQVKKGNASIEDIKPSGTYHCEKTGAGLVFMEN